MGNIKNKTIEIESIANKDGRFTIKDSENKTFSFFQYKSGTKETTQAFEQLMNGNHNQPFQKGDLALIGYSENDSTTRDGKPITYRNIVSMTPANIAPLSQPAGTIQERVIPQNTIHKEPEMESRKDYGKRLAIHGMVNGLLASGRAPANVVEMLQELINLEESIEIALQGSSSISVEDIPF